ncbi:MAG TPA: glycosyltransferase family 4 protein [Tepidisphaeraceae bacterium]|jgi:glycosyltransferase involved in cell wall biosynthesis|nr:glycosyltransferase family 4 protein [Tepidisphaeraceae bacterium]
MKQSTEPQTICMFTPSASGGHPLYTAELMTALAAQSHGGYRYELLSSVDLQPQFRDKPYPVHPILPALHHKRSYANRLAWVLSRVTHYPRRERAFLTWLKTRPDIAGVHLQEWKYWLAMPLIRGLQRQGKRVYHTVHNVYPHRYPTYLPKAFVDRLCRRAFMQCDGLFVLTDRLAEELKAFLGPAHPPIHVTPHGVWTVPDAEPSASIDERMTWKRLLFFGAIRMNKGLHLLLKAAESLPGYSITIAGDVWDRDYFAAQIVPQIKRLREMGVEVTLVDRFIKDEEVGPLFKSHSAIVLPYTKQFVAQSGVVYMALAYGLPVVASEEGGLRDLLREAQIGATFNEPTPEALATAVRSLESAEARQGLLQAMQAAKQRYSWKAAARATATAYVAISTEGRREEDVCTIRTSPAH